MKRLLNVICIVLTIIMVAWTVIEFCAIPALFVIIGLLNSFPWQYYVITIGGYIALFIIAEIIAHFVFKVLDKKYTPIIQRKFEKIFDGFQKENGRSV